MYIVILLNNLISYTNSYKSRVSPSYLLANKEFPTVYCEKYPLLPINKPKLPIHEFRFRIIKEDDEQPIFDKLITVVLKLLYLTYFTNNGRIH